ncbi:MAG TPA: NAD(P)H-binding protein [Casimicrobiaceae bacterium]|jgi:uncharacterized protein YbjT (DUF2867 family)|nr:NAD(P)H-binding protein [Casimicrobiaceae bacterium]
MRPVFVTGGTGYLGRALIDALLARDYPVHALVRPGSEVRLPRQAVPVTGDALDAASFVAAIAEQATVVHLVGTPHPSPSKAAEFQRVDLGSIRATASAAQRAGAGHIVYVSVAHPAPVMHAYVAARVEGEALVAATGIPTTILRPWYVLGPGHRWPMLLLPIYALLRLVPATRKAADRLGLVTQAQMTTALLDAVANPPDAGTRIVEVPGIRRAGP